ncbi:MAG: DNA translocase FtsK 4TM domain-containing protein, partial [Campylobacteraceae bacterium]|nr:DNA translocase FtsK 4TM domain-containing protein [Campylobacteraceae bacterium]
MFIIFIALSLFLGVSTILPDASIVGKFGAYLGKWNKEWFGYISFIYPFLFIIQTFSMYKDSRLNERRIGVFLASLILIFTFLMAQAILVKGVYNGYFGNSIVELLIGFIGIMGVWIFIISIFSLSMTLLVESSISDILTIIKPNFVKTKSKVYKAELKEIPFDEEISIKERVKLEKEAEPFIETTEEEVPEEVKKNIRTRNPKKSEILSEVEENKKILEQIDQGVCDKPKDFKLPPLSFLATPPNRPVHVNESEIDQKIQDLLEKLRRFKIDGDVVRTYSGPVVTTFEFKPAPHVKVSRILTLQDDLAMALKAKTIRIQAPIPGKDVVGIEVPNQKIETIY